MSGPCDIRIGRYCYWRGDESGEKPVTEPRAIEDRRAELLRQLDTAARSFPGDEWIAGQLVRYLVEAGRVDDALRAATTCRVSTVWCSVLAGYAAHSGSRFAQADSAFTIALAAMPDAERCRWLDVSEDLADDLSARFKTVPCDGREAFVRRITFLGTPLYLISGSDLFTEHLARVTRAKIAERSASPYGMGWADDQRALVVRYGWPAWYTRTAPDVWSQAEPSIVGHDAGMAYYFLPDARGLDATAHISADDWHLDDRGALSGYTPAYARTVHELPAQIASFRRHDTLLVVVAWDARRDTTLTGRTLETGLAIVNGDRVVAMRRDSTTRARGVLTVSALADSAMVSMEVLARADRRAARTRIGIPGLGPGRVTLSDVLLYSGPDTDILHSARDDSVRAVSDSALSGSTVPLSRVVGVYWETYGLHPNSEPVHFTLSVERIGVGWLQRTAERLNLTDPSSGLRLQWDEVPQLSPDGIAARGVQLDLTRLHAGRYVLRLSAAARGGTEAGTTREIVVP